MLERRSVDRPNHNSPEDPRHTTTNHTRPRTRYEDRVYAAGLTPRDSYTNCKDKKRLCIRGYQMTRDVHPTSHIIAGRRKDVCSVRTPLNLPDSVFMTRQLYLTHTANGLARRRHCARHATVPNLDYLVHPCASDHKRTVFIPIYGEQLCTRGWDSENGG